MMPMPGKKGVGILALMGSPDEGDEMGEKELAAKDLIAAVKSGDAAGVASAFKEMYDLCAASAGEDEDEEVAENEDELYGEE